MLGQGRFGPVFLADDPDGADPVVVRLFRGLEPGRARALVESLNALRARPLDHGAIARPLAAGLEGDDVVFVHAYRPGVQLDTFVAEQGPRPPAEVVMRLTPVAAALDFAAAAGVHHGMLEAPDVIVAAETAGLTGIGLVQALRTAGVHVPGAAATHADDIRALAALAYLLLSGRPFAGDLDGVASLASSNAKLAAAFDAALSPRAERQPVTALAFMRALQEAVSLAAHPARDDVLCVLPRRETGAVAAAAAADALAPLPDRPVGGVREPDDVGLPGETAVPDVSAPFPWASGVALGAVEPQVHPFRPGPSRQWSLASAALVAGGIIVGFGAGFFAAQRIDVWGGRGLRPPATEPSADAPQVSAGGAVQSSAAAAAAPSGAFVEPVEPSAGAPPGSATPLAGRPAPASPVERPRPGVLEVLSRPGGADVFVDGRLAGRTPLRLPGVQPGERLVRIQLAGHNQWMTAVRVGSGARVRVAASLEAQP